MTFTEEEQAIIDLLKQNKSYSYIAQERHTSRRNISRTKKRYEEEQTKNKEQNSVVNKESVENQEQNKVQLSKPSQVLKLFCEGKKTVEVAIELDMQIAEVDRVYKEYSESNGLYDLNQVYEDIKKNGSISSFVKLYQIIKQERMGMLQVANLLKICEEIPYLEAKYQRIKDVIEKDGPKVLDLIKQKLSLRNDIQSILGELPSFRSYVDNELKHEQEKLDKQKASLTNEVNKWKECAINEINNSKECLLALRDAADKLKSIRKEVDKLKQEEQRLTSRIELLKNEERQEQYVQRPQSQPQQTAKQGRPIRLEQEQKKDNAVETEQELPNDAIWQQFKSHW